MRQTKTETRSSARLSWRTLAIIDEKRKALVVGDDGEPIIDDPEDPAFDILRSSFDGGGQTICKTLSDIASSVGRIDLNGRGFGSGVLVAPNKVLTALHVIAEMVAACDDLFGADQPTIDFRPKPSADASPYRCTMRALTGALPVGAIQAGDDTMDIALVEIDPAPADLTALRPNLTYRFDVLDDPARPAIAVIGFPSYSNRQGNKLVKKEIEDAIHFCFGKPGAECYNRKCIGIHTMSSRETARNSRALYVDHAAPTMPQCSGGPLIDLMSMTLIGIHTGGEHLADNMAQSLAATVRTQVNDVVDALKAL